MIPKGHLIRLNSNRRLFTLAQASAEAGKFAWYKKEVESKAARGRCRIFVPPTKTDYIWKQRLSMKPNWKCSN